MKLISKDNINSLRKFSYGYVGGKDIAEKATNRELQLLVYHKDKAAAIANQIRNRKL